MTDESVKPTDEQKIDDAREEGRTAAGGDATAQAEAAPEHRADEGAEGAPTGGPASDWPELDEYRERLRAEHAAWSERLTAVQSQLAHVRPALDRIAAQYAALGVEEDIVRLCEQVLGGAGMVQRVRFDFDLERYVTLAWPAAADPRPDLAAAHREGEYRVDVWFGLGADGRGRVRVEGAKRLEAPLPTSRARLRAVLLGAIQAPRHVPPPSAESAPETAEAGSPPGRTDDAAARPEQAETQPPPEEQVINLGPASTEPEAGRTHEDA